MLILLEVSVRGWTFAQINSNRRVHILVLPWANYTEHQVESIHIPNKFRGKAMASPNEKGKLRPELAPIGSCYFPGILSWRQQWEYALVYIRSTWDWLKCTCVNTCLSNLVFPLPLAEYFSIFTHCCCPLVISPEVYCICCVEWSKVFHLCPPSNGQYWLRFLLDLSDYSLQGSIDKGIHTDIE